MSDIERMVERVVPADAAADLGAMTMMLYGLPRPIEEVDAIAVYPGLGEMWRVHDAVDAWEDDSTQARHLLLAGNNPVEETQPLLTMDYLTQSANLRNTEGVHTQITAQNTPDQAQWLAGKVQELGVSSVGLFVSPYHLLRAYCTTLKTFEKLEVPRIPIIPMPVRVAPEVIIPETGVDAVDMFYGEAKRIAAYQAKGDVATLPELKDYISWLWKQPILSAS